QPQQNGQREGLPPRCRHEYQKPIRCGESSEKNSRLQVHLPAVALAASAAPEELLDAPAKLRLKAVAAPEFQPSSRFFHSIKLVYETGLKRVPLCHEKTPRLRTGDNGLRMPLLHPNQVASFPRAQEKRTTVTEDLQRSLVQHQCGHSLVEGGDGFILRLGGGAVHIADLAHKPDVSVNPSIHRLDAL